MHLPFWLSSLLLAPVVVIQAQRTRRNTPRLPEATGNDHGQWGKGKAVFRLLVIGESTAAGVGVSDHQQGLASQLALQLHENTGQTIGWRTRGSNGIRLAGLLETLKTSPLHATDVVLLSMGVNDTTGLTPRYRYRQQLQRLQQQTTTRSALPLMLIAVPPMHRFTALPTPLRHLLGWRAGQLDAMQARLARNEPECFQHLTYPSLSDTALLARDGYHPGEKGYREMARSLAAQLLVSLNDKVPLKRQQESHEQ